MNELTYRYLRIYSVFIGKQDLIFETETTTET